MKFLVEHIIKELDDADTYINKAIECEDTECKTCYRQLASEELSHFERLVKLYMRLVEKNGKYRSEVDDLWISCMKNNVEKVRSKINEL